MLQLYSRTPRGNKSVDLWPLLPWAMLFLEVPTSVLLEDHCDKLADECGGFVEGCYQLVKSGVLTIDEDFKQRSEDARKRRR
jgi:hypothetical protein